jgi:hypothetical protein
MPRADAHEAPPPGSEPGPGAGARGATRHAAPLALFAAVALLLLGPSLGEVGQAIPGQPTSDAYDHYWGYAWFARALAGGELPLRTTLSHWPDGGLLWFVDPVGALLSLPFQAVGGAALGYPAALALQLWGGMAAMYALAWSSVRARGPAVLAGVIYGASPYALSLVYSGTTEYLTLAPLPLFWLHADRALGAGRRRDALLAGACWAWATLGNFYYAAFAALLLGLAVLAARHRGRALVAPLAALVGSWALLAAPILGVAAWTLTAPDAVVSRATAPGWSYGSLPATDLLTFLHPGDYYFPDTRRFGNLGILHVNYLGWVATLAALAGALRAPRLRLPLALAAVIALGPTLAFDGRLVTLGERPVPLPAALLYFPGSPFRFVHHPYRLVVLPLLFGGLAAAHAVAARPRLALALAGAVLAETLTLSPAVWPFPTAPVAAPAPYLALAADPTVEGIWDFPPGHRAANRWYQSLAVAHGRRIPYGVNQFLPKKFASNHLVRALMGCLRRPAEATIPREGGRPLEAFLQRADPRRIEDGREALRRWGYAVVVLHHDRLDATEAACAEGLIGAGVREGEVSTHRLGAR